MKKPAAPGPPVSSCHTPSYLHDKSDWRHGPEAAVDAEQERLAGQRGKARCTTAAKAVAAWVRRSRSCTDTLLPLFVVPCAEIEPHCAIAPLKRRYSSLPWGAHYAPTFAWAFSTPVAAAACRSRATFNMLLDSDMPRPRPGPRVPMRSWGRSAYPKGATRPPCDVGEVARCVQMCGSRIRASHRCHRRHGLRSDSRPSPRLQRRCWRSVLRGELHVTGGGRWTTNETRRAANDDRRRASRDERGTAKDERQAASGDECRPANDDRQATSCATSGGRRATSHKRRATH